TGVRYVDDKIVVPGLWFVIAALVLGATLAAANVRASRVRNIGVALAIPALTYLVAGVLAPGYVTTFVVRPNELVRETPYIRNNIDFTRKAYGLDHIEEVPFEPRLTNTVFDPAQHSDTLENARLWDWHALQSTLRQIQEIRTYYDFPDIDVDRYLINGKPEAMMLAVRELSLKNLPSGSRNWVNERLIYTHGYGITMNSVSRFTKEGLPDFLLSNMPVESARPELRVSRPEIYFGEITDWPVYVKTRQKEFNYPEGDSNNYSTHEGTGGIRMGSFFRRLLLAWSVGDLTKVPFSDDITADSMLLMRRNIRDRVAELAPFLIFDQDPYIVLGTDGALYWIIDGFTASDRYPYSRLINVGNRAVNYIRNSVKTVVDAYNGTLHFYVFDTSDPLIQSYQKMFPALFSSAGQMPGFLRAHVRYPELLFRAQSAIYTTYHVDNEQVFYNREDVWTIAQQGSRQQGQQVADAIESFFILMRFPGSSDLEFVSILPFTPANRNNLIGWLAGRSDGEKYGTLRAYRFPKTRFVDGPLQIQARIDQDPQLSSQLTLWNQQGSTVIRGNLLVIPLEDNLLFVEPMYLQAERSPMPELRLVVLATQDRLAYAPRFPEALDALLKGGTPSAAAGPAPPPATTNAGSTDIRSWVDRANQAFSEYQRLTAEGKLAEAGNKLDDLKRTLEEMRRLSSPPK
ncbi:MAG: membrane protein, partial [Acidobacteria bacterium]